MSLGNKSSLSGLEKAAILMNVLGKEKSFEIMKGMRDADVKKLLSIMGGMRKAPVHLINSVLREYLYKLSETDEILFDNNFSQAEFVTEGLGEARAKQILGTLKPTEEGHKLSLTALESIDIDALADFLRDEHPQTIALVVAHMELEKQTKVLRLFPEGLRPEIIVRMASLDQVAPERVTELDEILKRELAGGMTQRSLAGGIEGVAEIINNLDRKTMTSILSNLEQKDPDLLGKIKSFMFQFTDMIKIDSKAIQMVLREVPNDKLMLALKSAPDELRDHVCAAMSERAALLLREDLAASGPQRVSDVEAAQREIVNVVLKLKEEGKIRIASGDDQELVS